MLGLDNIIESGDPAYMHGISGHLKLTKYHLPFTTV